MKSEWANSSKYLLTSLLITEQAVTSSSQLLSTSADGMQQLRTEIQSMNGGKKKKTLMQNPSSVCNGTPTGLTFFLPTTNPVTSSWKQNNDIISDLIALTVGVDLSPHFVLLFLVSSGITCESKPPLGKENLLFFGKIPVFSIRVFDIHAGVRWGLVLFQGLFLSYRAFFCAISLFTFPFQNFRWKEVWE